MKWSLVLFPSQCCFNDIFSLHSVTACVSSLKSLKMFLAPLCHRSRLSIGVFPSWETQNHTEITNNYMLVTALSKKLKQVLEQSKILELNWNWDYMSWWNVYTKYKHANQYWTGAKINIDCKKKKSRTNFWENISSSSV